MKLPFSMQNVFGQLDKLRAAEQELAAKGYDATQILAHRARTSAQRAAEGAAARRRAEPEGAEMR